MDIRQLRVWGMRQVRNGSTGLVERLANPIPSRRRSGEHSQRDAAWKAMVWRGGNPAGWGKSRERAMKRRAVRYWGGFAIEEKTAGLGWIRKLIRRPSILEDIFLSRVKRKWRESYWAPNEIVVSRWAASLTIIINHSRILDRILSFVFIVITIIFTR